eukprot:scaffold318328_cov12-Tisochrysis_lutea.AAC.1
MRYRVQQPHKEFIPMNQAPLTVIKHLQKQTRDTWKVMDFCCLAGTAQLGSSPAQCFKRTC